MRPVALVRYDPAPARRYATARSLPARARMNRARRRARSAPAPLRRLRPDPAAADSKLLVTFTAGDAGSAPAISCAATPPASTSSSTGWVIRSAAKGRETFDDRGRGVLQSCPGGRRRRHGGAPAPRGLDGGTGRRRNVDPPSCALTAARLPSPGRSLCAAFDTTGTFRRARSILRALPSPDPVVRRPRRRLRSRDAARFNESGKTRL